MHALRKYIIYILVIFLNSNSYGTELSREGCLIDKYSQFIIARKKFWTLFHKERIPNLPKYTQYRDDYLKLVELQEERLGHEVNEYIRTNSWVTNLEYINSFNVPYYSGQLLTQEQYDKLLEYNDRFKELVAEEEKIIAKLNKVKDIKFEIDNPKERIYHFQHVVMPQLKADFNNSRTQLLGICK